MKEKTQLALVVALGLVFCAGIICYNVFFTQPVNVYEVSAASQASAETASASSFEGVLSLNSASAEELAQLPGISDSVAGKIVDYRELHGGFLTVDEIMEVDGIGEKTYEKVKMYLYIE